MLRALCFLTLVVSPALAGPTYVRAKGVFKIDDTGKVTRVVADGELPIAMTVDNDGDVWVSSVAGKITGHKTKPIVVRLPSKSQNSRFPVAMIAAKDGGIWALGREQLFRIGADGKLQQHPLFVPRLLGPAHLLEVGDVLWIASENGLHKFAAGIWTAARAERHEHLARDSSGVVWSAMHVKDKPDVLVGFDGNKWLEMPIAGEGVVALSSGKDGRLYVAELGGSLKAPQIQVLTTTGGVAKWTLQLTGTGDSYNDLRVDADERLWVRRGGGLALLDKQGKLKVDFPLGSIAGLPGNVQDFIVVGGGPATLPTPGATPTGTIKGRFMKTRKDPLASTKLVLCAGNCTDTAAKLEITTDADGKFTVENAQAVEYTSIQLDTTVHSISNFRRDHKPLACCLAIVAGKSLDLGTVRAP